jgi:hypothetical protein
MAKHGPHPPTAPNLIIPTDSYQEEHIINIIITIAAAALAIPRSDVKKHGNRRPPGPTEHVKSKDLDHEQNILRLDDQNITIKPLFSPCTVFRPLIHPTPHPPQQKGGCFLSLPYFSLPTTLL